jgi:hypothetical protein
VIFYNNLPFSDPAPVWLWNPLAAAGIYAVQVVDAEGSPRPIYFGRTEEFYGRGAVSSHHAFRSWAREAGSEVELWISVHRESNAMQRVVKQATLIQKYATVCNAQELAPPTTV